MNYFRLSELSKNFPWWLYAICYLLDMVGVFVNLFLLPFHRVVWFDRLEADLCMWWTTKQHTGEDHEG